ncbi:DUF1654 domain-containing protein [Babesia caballi]|uniref:DUF1654 domain-containing protein n=1 Tax=Babesia caballi TaxID=5871 RepID=A0AAV4LQE6_BABCB|nr:DUF1654 domain-containing protein [Babesia caballi]
MNGMGRGLLLPDVREFRDRYRLARDVDAPKSRKITQEVVTENEEEGVDGFKQVLERLPCDDGLELVGEGFTSSFSVGAIGPLPKQVSRTAKRETVTVQQWKDAAAVYY